jgi:uncharacterized protein (DUF608 family)
LAPREERTIKFYLGWYVPDRVLETSLAFGNEEVENTKLKNYYAVKFSSPDEVLSYYIANEENLLRQSRRFTENLFSTTMPDYVLDAISANTAILKTNLLMRTSEGWIHGFEGLGDESGCCPGNCTHVWNYAQTLSALFPSLERNAREISFSHDTFENGYQCFRSVIPLGDYWFRNVAADGQMGNIIRVYREWKYSGDSEWLKKLWPKVKLALEFAWKGSGEVTGKYSWQNHARIPWDPEKEGVMRGDQHNTYDINFFGPNMMTGSMYLAALKACSEMAAHFGETEKSAEYLGLYEQGLSAYKNLLWNGEYFTQKIEIYPGIEIPEHLKSPPDDAGTIIPKYQLGDGCLTDQLLGQFLAHNAGLGFIIDKDLVRQAMESVYRHNFIRDLSVFSNVQRVFGVNEESGLVIASWPKRNRPRIPFVYSDEVWTGIEYGAAVNMINAGLVDEGLAVVEAVRNRYRGYNRNPWGEIESGMFYARAMASWGLLNALSGFVFDGVRHSILFDPAINSGNFRSFWSCGTGWGLISQNNKEVTLALDYGELVLSEITLPQVMIRKIILNDNEVQMNYINGIAQFANTLTLKEGDALHFIR